MASLFDRVTVLIMLSAIIVALLCVLPQTRGIFPFWVMGAGLHMADTLFHEMGHTIFAWLFGHPTIPMIFTLFGADQAGGMSMIGSRSMFVQIAAYAVLAMSCYWIKDNMRPLLIPAIIFSAAITALSFSPYYQIVIAYMGHGGAMAMGGFFLWRAWIYLDARNEFERWLNALFGFFLTLYNMFFGYSLAFDSDARGDYMDHVAFGISHNDFWAIAVMVPGWSVRGVALFAIGYGLTMIVGSFVIASYQQE